MSSRITSPQVTNLLDPLYADAATKNPLARQAAKRGGAVPSPHTDHEGMDAFLDYIHTPAYGYVSSAIFTAGPGGKAHEVTIRR